MALSLPDPGQARLAAARAFAWALLMGGWIGLTHLAERYATGAMQSFMLVAGWLLALGVAATLAARWTASAWLVRALLLACAVVAARGMVVVVQGGGAALLWPVMLAWALLVAFASTTVRALRLALPRAPGASIAPAAAGVLLAGWVAGDPGDSAALAARLAAALIAAALLLGLWLPAAGTRAARAGCRAGLFDCALPAWPAGGWREPARWPLLLAALAMLPMMAGLPQTLALCRASALSAPALIVAHVAAMFLPALLWPARLSMATRSRACAALLVAGGCVLWWQLPGAWLWAMLAHGCAWSLAWSAQLDEPALRAAPRSAPWRAAIGHACLALTLGAAVSLAGPQALQGVHLVLAAAAALGVVLVVARAGASLRARSRFP
ncbi:hypothetical protein [uncultured Piscinibacter sp.]|uniref:hypothetical protein n=1 Tax=uncultured Piscinibacter sp. TaxID=1131835 RepID=UPI0026016D12|nr:hypothetical protein [uncultured Piscinibacter sp.]